jgi:hypothetical protein
MWCSDRRWQGGLFRSCTDSLWRIGRWAAVSNDLHLAALIRHPPCTPIGKFRPDEIGENDQVDQKNEPDRYTPPFDIPHGLIPCGTAAKALLLPGGAELILGRRGKLLQRRRDHRSPGSIQHRMRLT